MGAGTGIGMGTGIGTGTGMGTALAGRGVGIPTTKQTTVSATGLQATPISVGHVTGLGGASTDKGPKKTVK